MKACVICGFDRAVDRCHLIPVSLARYVPDLNKFLPLDGDHIVSLCKNHHFLFDHGRLTEEEGNKLTPYYVRIKNDVRNLLNSRLMEIAEETLNQLSVKDRKKHTDLYQKKVRELDIWKERVFWFAGFQRNN